MTFCTNTTNLHVIILRHELSNYTFLQFLQNAVLLKFEYDFSDNRKVEINPSTYQNPLVNNIMYAKRLINKISPFHR